MNLAKKNLDQFGLNVDFNQIKKYCENHHISSLKFFGTIITENFTDSSDIDILVEFEDGFIPAFFKFIEIQRKLSEFFNNRKVDLRTKEDLSRYFRQDVMNKAVRIFV